MTDRTPTPERLSNSPRSNLTRNPDKSFGDSVKKYDERNRTMRSRSPARSPVRKAPEPSASNPGQTSSRSHSPNGTPKRVRKGVALLSSTHLCVVTVLHRPNVLVVMVVEIFMEEILMGNNLHILFMGKYLFYDTLLSKTLGFNSFIL